MLDLAEALPVHERWSEVNREFLEFVQRNPEYLRRDSFASLCGAPALRRFGLQPWPLFISSARLGELESLALGIDRLVKSVFPRFLGNSPARIAEYFRSAGDPADQGGFTVRMSREMLMLLLDEPSGIESAPSRGDYMETAEGLRCIELNCGGSLGGLPNNLIAEHHLASPGLARFLGERGLAARGPDTMGALFRHVLDDTARVGTWKGGELNVALLVRPSSEEQIALTDPELCNRELRKVLEERGVRAGGKALLCGPEDFVEDGGVLKVEGRPVHAVVEMHDTPTDLRFLFWSFKRGRISLYSGPISFLLTDKRNMALVSENAGSDEFTAEERALIERHVPWTRRVVPGATEFRGRGVRLPDDLPALRRELVLKKGTSMGGHHVHLGRACTDEQWSALVARALREEDWVVQEHLDSVPYCFQHGEAGASRSELIWGLLAFGSHFGGAFLRMQPSSGESRVVNTAQGAEVGIMLEVAG